MFCGLVVLCISFFFFFSSRRRHTRYIGDWSSDVCSSDLYRHNRLRNHRSKRITVVNGFPNLAIYLNLSCIPRISRLRPPSTHVQGVVFSTKCEWFCAIPRNCRTVRHVQSSVNRRGWAISILFAAASLAGAAYNDYASAKQKVDSIEADSLRSGARVILTFPELNAWVAKEAPAGVRNPQLRATAREVASAGALIDFGKLERSAGRQPGWLMSKILAI